MPKAAEKKEKKPKKHGSEESQEEFAVIETGGKQYKVKSGDVISIEKLSDDYSDGDEVTFDKVLIVDNGKDTTIGTPYIPEAKVLGTLEAAGKGKKVHIMTYKAKSRYVRRKGHRQEYMKVKIKAIR